jgi:imidazolonepropionase-like amidohydrolase
MRRIARTWGFAGRAFLIFTTAHHFASAQTQSAAPLNNEAGPPVAITGVTLIDVATGQRHNGVTVVTRGDRIAAVDATAAIPVGAARVNGKGKFLIPGLWDMHSHHQGTGADWLDLFVAKGVVGTRDMGGDADFILPLRARVKSGAVLGPEIVASGPILDDPLPGFPYRRRVTNAQDAREAVADLKRLGVDFIKVHDHTPREVFFAIAQEAPRLGLPFAGHVPMSVKVEEAADAGIRSIEHLSNYEVFGECLVNDEYTAAGCRRLFEKLAAKGVWQTPTMAFFQTLPDVFEGKPLEHAEYASDSLLKLTRGNIEASHVPASTLEKMRLAAHVSLQAIHDLHTMGNQFLAGCDGLVPGFCLHDELEWFTKAGFSPLEALQTATINPARFLGRENSQGNVQVGKRADLVLLDADPLLDIRNVTRIADVVVRGKLVTKPEIDRIIASHRRTDGAR